MLALAAAAIALAAGFSGYKVAMARAPEVAAAIRDDTRVTEEWIANLEASPEGPVTRDDFCEGVMQGAADVLWQEQMKAEGAAAEAAQEVYRH